MSNDLDARAENRPAGHPRLRAPASRGSLPLVYAQLVVLEDRWVEIAAEGPSILHQYRNEIAADGRCARYEY